MLSYHQTFHLTFSSYCKWQPFLSLPFSLLCTSQTSSNLYLVPTAATLQIWWRGRKRRRRGNSLEFLEEMEIEEMDLFEKKKDEIFKKAKKISSVYDADVSIILISSDKLFVYTTPNSTMKKIIDQYQNTVGVDLWSSYYEKMEEELRRLKDMNTTLRRVMMERKGEELHNLNMEQLFNLEHEMILALRLVRDRKYRVLNNEVEVYKKKVRNLEDMQWFLMNDLEELENRKREMVEDGGFDSDAAVFAVQQLRLERIEEESSSIAAVGMEVEDSV